MTRPVRYTARAEASLDAIADWTYDTFGPAQATAYIAAIQAACERLGSGDLASRRVRDQLAPRAPEDLRFVRVGSHYVLFRESSVAVEVTDVLHAAMDVPRRA